MKDTDLRNELRKAGVLDINHNAYDSASTNSLVQRRELDSRTTLHQCNGSVRTEYPIKEVLYAILDHLDLYLEAQPAVPKRITVKKKKQDE